MGHTEDEDEDSNHLTKVSIRKKTCLKFVSDGIIGGLENAFYKLGKAVATYPILTIIICIVICGLFGIGMKDFNQTTEDAELWVPATSRIQSERKWVLDNFPPITRYASLILVENNVLSERSFQAMYDLYQQALNIEVNGKKFEDMCYSVAGHCYVNNILEIWSYNKTVINSLTLEDKYKVVNQNVTYSPLYHKETDITTLIGKIRRHRGGAITGAESAVMLFLLQDNLEWKTEAMEWESKMIKIANQGHEHIRQIYIYTTRSFDDEGYGAVNSDTKLLSAGFSIVFIYVILTLGRFNLLEQKLYLSLAGLLVVGLSIMFAYGLAMACGVIYGPVHALMPFLLLGIGVDDMFVIVEAWKNLTHVEQKLSLVQRMALTLKRAGVSVTVTSVTDIVAFAVGASTVIPGLSGFCIYAALGIFALFLLQSTFFVACLTLDQMRVEARRNAIICCYVHKNYEINECSKRDYGQLFFKHYYGPFLMKLPVKITVMLITALIVGVNLYGFIQLRQDFDLTMYIPSDSYAHKYAKAKEAYFPYAGIDSAVYCRCNNPKNGFLGDLSYKKDVKLFEEMIKKVKNSTYVQNGTVVNWYEPFHYWLVTTNKVDIRYLIGADGYPYSNYAFAQLLYKFITETRIGQAFSPYVKFTNTTPPFLQGTYIPFRHTYQGDSKKEIKAMESLRDITDQMGFSTGKCFPYAVQYLTYETNKILQVELYRNLALAGVCVFIVTLLLIANLWTSLIVFTCVIFTLIDVAGTLYFWDVTIDTASSILLTLSVGLAVDYSAHIGHTYMTIIGEKNERPIKALAAIGPAVFSGGFSTFLAFLLLSRSNSYGFALFFRVFFTVVVFGLFHGLAYLPVILSWIGPEPYHNEEDNQKYLHNGLSNGINADEKEEYEMDADSGCIRQDTSTENSPLKSSQSESGNSSEVTDGTTCAIASSPRVKSKSTNCVDKNAEFLPENESLIESNKDEMTTDADTDTQDKYTVNHEEGS
ncbi:NPC1-like intracellular cholesterol transporter 1 isoform X1 [Mytilus californianus]|uniref:NPC1-like intracellular cholesterol transporter 1 isoform X1 n=1 Tax=Mytilus californianus TaxID=6549 RepID=UPI00224639D5|nr:NPC1-like intracellular cholesterol transporter 1 isoform X1 [Mytilus californianus]